MRHHIGFDRLWSMQIPVPYSLFVRSGSFGWSCGQCPLDRAGHVVAPGDALAQTHLVARYARTLLAEADFSLTDLRMAVVYHDMPDPTQPLAHLRETLGPTALLVPVKVPAFYYPGMLVEVDLFAMSQTAGLRFVAGGPDILTVRSLIDHWVAPLHAQHLPPHAILDPAQPQTQVWSILSDQPLWETTLTHGPTTVFLRQSGTWHALTATAPIAPGLVPQTEAIMEAFAATLSAQGLAFTDVVKSTTHYVGAPTPQELHDNMAVRNRRYHDPGPASTGIRVHALADPGAKTAITLLVHRPDFVAPAL